MSIKDKFQLKIRDREGSANILAAGIFDSLSKEERSPQDIFVFAIPRGGVIVADIIAKN